MNPFKQFVTQLSTASKTKPYGMPYAPTSVSGANKSVVPKTFAVSSNVGATSPQVKKPAYTPFVPDKKITQSQLPPSGQQFAQTLSQSAGLSTVPGPYDPETGKLKSNPSDVPQNPLPTVTPSSVPESPYLKYLNSMFDPESLKTSYNKSTQANERLAEIQNEAESANYTARKEKEQLLGRSGTGVGANARAANEAIRRSSPGLADLALEESAAARTAGVLGNNFNNVLEAGKEAYNLEQEQNKPIEINGQLFQKQPDGSYKSVVDTNTPEGFTLGKDQVRYDAEGNIVAGNVSPTGTDIYTPGANPVVDAWVKGIQSGTYKASDVPDELKNQVAQALSGTPKPQSEIGRQVVTTIDDLLASPAFDSIFGPVDQYIGGILGPQAILAKNKYNQLKGLLSLDNIKYLKGTGAISDAEQKLLSEAATAVGRNLYGSQAREELTKLREGLSRIKSSPSAQPLTEGIDDSFFNPANFDN